VERFLKADKEYGPREHGMFLFAVAHGARPQEITNLKFKMVNFKDKKIYIRRLKGSPEMTMITFSIHRSRCS